MLFMISEDTSIKIQDVYNKEIIEYLESVHNS